MSEDQQVWSQVFYWLNYESEPTMEWPQAKYITYTKFMDKQQWPKIIGYIQFCSPIQKDMLSTIDSSIHWTDQRFSNSACIRYIEKINIQEGGELVTLGEHWPVKPYIKQEDGNESMQPEQKKKASHPYSEETANLSANSSTAVVSNTLKPVFHSNKAYLSYARKHLKIIKSKDTCYLKYFAQQCQEKMENREIVPEKTSIDRDYFIIRESLLKSALARLNKISCCLINYLLKVFYTYITLPCFLSLQ